MQFNRFRNDLQKGIASNDVGQEDISDHKRNEPEKGVLQDAFDPLLCIPRLFVESNLLRAVSVYPIFDLSKNKLHEYCLRTEPSAEQAAVNNGKQDDKNDQDYQHQSEKVQVLRPECSTEQRKLTLKDVYFNKLIPVYFNKWSA